MKLYIFSNISEATFKTAAAGAADVTVLDVPTLVASVPETEKFWLLQFNILSVGVRCQTQQTFEPSAGVDTRASQKTGPLLLS